MYISKDPFEKLGFLSLPHYPMPHLTETIQHSIFAYMWAPITLFAILAGVMWKKNPEQITEAIYLATLSRKPSPEERKTSLAYFQQKDITPQMAAEDILWALMNSAEFVFNH